MAWHIQPQTASFANGEMPLTGGNEKAPRIRGIVQNKRDTKTMTFRLGVVLRNMQTGAERSPAADGWIRDDGRNCDSRHQEVGV